jgi:hypothetical protein
MAEAWENRQQTRVGSTDFMRKGRNGTLILEGVEGAPVVGSVFLGAFMDIVASRMIAIWHGVVR